MIEEIAEVYDDFISRGAKPSPELEAYAGQVVRLRDAQRRLAAEGSVIADPKGNPIPHPALQIERMAQDEIRKWKGKIRLP